MSARRLIATHYFQPPTMTPKFEATIMIEETRSITSTGSEINANILLKAGWTLLLVANRENRDMKWAHFVFGWQMPQDPPEVRFSGVEPTIDI
ncbi:hypothetical protein [Pseudomonas agarici]|uniref:hypothetical protein n=1 Tax=Pseudomonas agarici TaxID=46677 RepID=UPI0012E3C41B|nr:hypothetical protein [Pseudomonas agarici]